MLASNMHIISPPNDNKMSVVHTSSIHRAVFVLCIMYAVNIKLTQVDSEDSQEMVSEFFKRYRYNALMSHGLHTVHLCSSFKGLSTGLCLVPI